MEGTGTMMGRYHILFAMETQSVGHRTGFPFTSTETTLNIPELVTTHEIWRLPGLLYQPPPPQRPETPARHSPPRV